MKNTPGSGIWHKLSPGSPKGLWPFWAQLGPSYSFPLYLVAWGRKKSDQTWKLWLRCTWEFEFSLGINLVQNSEAGNCLEWRVAGVYALTCTAKRISSTGATRTRQQTWPLPTLTEPRECQYCRHSNRDSLLKQIPHQSHYPCSGLQLGAALELANWVPSGWNCTGDHAWGEYLAHLLHIHGTRQELVQPHPPPSAIAWVPGLQH